MQRRFLRFFLALFLCASPAYGESIPSLRELNLDEADGRIIKTIQIIILPIFDEANPGWLYEQANNVKTSTKEETVREELRLVEGAIFHAFEAQETVRRLRELKFLRDTTLRVFDEGGPVRVLIQVQDTWTLIPQLNFSSGSGKNSRSIGLSEGNLFGRGERFEVSLQEDDSRETFETVYDDPHFLSTDQRLVGAYFDRSDGQELFGYFGRPARTLLDEDTWYVSGTTNDFVGRLYEAGSENYLYREQINFVEARYSLAFGDPEKKRSRLSFGFDASDLDFSQARPSDYEDLNLDPSKVSNSRSRLAEDRRDIGPAVGYTYVEPEFISMNYIDRFDRVEDYNLGAQHGVTISYAADYLGSFEDSLIFSTNEARGVSFSRESFARGEIGAGGRVAGNGFENTVVRGEGKYFNVLGDIHLLGAWVGRHTLASSVSLEYGHDFDRDRQFLLGADNGLRGYEARSFTGDKRVVLNIEDRMHFVDDWQELISVGGAIFADVGGATYDTLNTLLEDQLYADAGFGLRLAFPRSSGGRVLRIDIAFPLRDGPDGGSSAEFRVIFAGGNIFSSQLRSEPLGTEKANVAVGFEKP